MDDKSKRNLAIFFLVLLFLVAVALLVVYLVKKHNDNKPKPPQPPPPPPPPSPSPSPGNKSSVLENICSKFGIRDCTSKGLMEFLKNESKTNFKKLKTLCPNLNFSNLFPFIVALLEAIANQSDVKAPLVNLIKFLESQCPGVSPGQRMMMNNRNSKEMYSNDSCGCGC